MGFRSKKIGVYVVLSLLTLMVFSLLYFFYYPISQIELDKIPSGNLIFFLLMNLNIIVIMVFGFLVFKNLLRLIAERKRGFPGSKLRSRLVIAFVALSLVPTALLFIVSKGILGSVMDNWFSPQVRAGMEGAIEATRLHYSHRKAELARSSYYMGKDLERILSLINVGDESFSKEEKEIVGLYVSRYILENGFTYVEIINSKNKVLFKDDSFESFFLKESFLKVNLASLNKALNGKIDIRIEEGFDSEFMRAYVPLYVSYEPEGYKKLDYLKNKPITKSSKLVLVVSVLLPYEFQQVVTKVIEADDDYTALKINRRPLNSTYILALAGVTFLIIFTAIWFGFFLAKTLTEPIERLSYGTRQVAKGNLNVKIKESGDDEISSLVKLFNTMTSDLKDTRDKLIRGRQYTETVLESLDVGVMSVDITKKISTCNVSAASVLGLKSFVELVGKDYTNLVPAPLASIIDSFFKDSYNFSEPRKSNILIMVNGVLKHIQVSVAPLVSQEGDNLGAVVLVDDFTELVKAQKVAAWREVARRIAHEIKNPLTPIQLSAQRMHRRFVFKEGKSYLPDTNTEESKALISTCTNTIVTQVQVLRTLVNEFSRFARMPKTNPQLSDLNELILSVVTMYEEGHPEIKFKIDLCSKLKDLLIDKEQINRVIVNLLDNAVSSVRERFFDEEGKRKIGVLDLNPSISIFTKVDIGLGLSTLMISDNGVGIAKIDRMKVFEPHFSTKKSGTGLGLSIVHSIILDHGAYVRIKDNDDLEGVCFVIEFPIP